jgi:hypothetical protein
MDVDAPGVTAHAERLMGAKLEPHLARTAAMGARPAAARRLAQTVEDLAQRCAAAVSASGRARLPIDRYGTSRGNTNA